MFAAAIARREDGGYYKTTSKGGGETCAGGADGQENPVKIFRSRFGGLYLFGAVFVAASFLLRMALWAHWGRGMGVGAADLAKATVVGLLFDVATFLCLAAPASLILLVLPDRAFRWRPGRYVAAFFYFVSVFVLLFDLTAEWLFWDELGVRFNFVAVDYLVYTQEVLGNIRESYPLAAIFAGIAAAAALTVLLTRKALWSATESTDSLGRRLLAGGILLLAPAMSLLLVDQSLANVSANACTNELAKNGLYSFVTALRGNVLEYDQFYITGDPASAFTRLRGLLKTDNSRYLSQDPMDITRQMTAPGPEERHNVLIVVLESMSAEYLGAFGAQENLTPNLDALAKESLFFRRCYATGTRTDRGLEAVALSIPPTPGRSILKRPGNAGMFSIGQIFRQRGYVTKFIYSGSNRFDDMGGFFKGNGFGTIEQSNFAANEITFTNAWGACDEDLYRRTLKECDKSFASGRPFMSVVMTTSNHRPFTYPQKIDIPSGSGRQGAVKYADFAIGQFIQQARTRPWFGDTLIVFLADHCASSAGRTQVPADKYHIPLLIYAPELVKPAQVDKLTSQIDLAPTLMGLLHFTYQSRFFGRDVLADGQGRAPLGIYQEVGLLTDDKLEVLLPKKRSITFSVGPDGEQHVIAPDEGLLGDAVAYYQSAAYLLKQHLYTPTSQP